MRKRMIWNDIMGNRLLSVTTWVFMAASAFLFGLTCFLSVTLLGSVNTLMEEAQTPDFLQMHTGEISEEELTRFAETNPDVRAFQVLRFLNLENGTIFLNGQSLSDSTQDNGVCVQSEKFDFLLDLENQVMEVSGGEIYVPVCYRQEYDLHTGDRVEIGDTSFEIAGFLRDSQMNSKMASSKRFLVSEADYMRLQKKGSEEYLIEFLLEDGADVGVFATEYTDAGLPANGPAITRPLILMMNALSDGLMILVILLASFVLVLIAVLCIRFTLLTQLEKDRKEIGMLKAIGISKRDIRRIYFIKFLGLSGLGAVTGLAFAALTEKVVSAHMQELYGPSQHTVIPFLVASTGILMTEGTILFSIRRTLKHIERLSAVEALIGQQERRKIGQNLIVVLVIGLGVFLMILPQNLLSTISSSAFVTYMGIGDADIRMDIRQTDDIAGKTEQMERILSEDTRVKRFVTLQTSTCRITLPDGSSEKMNVEQGDHTIFPVTYAEGAAPRKKGEIALSYLCAEELGMSVGDTLALSAKDGEYEYRICGIYSDITNGGKTAKAAVLPTEGELMWGICYVSLEDQVEKESWILEYTDIASDQGISAQTVDIQEYVEDTYGQTIREVRMAARVAILMAILVIVVVVILFTRLFIARDRYDISLQKAIGIAARVIRTSYVIHYIPVVFIGIVAGVLSGNLLGEYVAGILLKSLGATGFHVQIDPWIVCGCIPGFTVAAVLCAILIGLSEVKYIKAYECCVGKE